MPHRLVHVYPQWETPEDEPWEEPREIWTGKMRIVHAQRARKLRRRGVPLMDLRPSSNKGYNAAGRAKYAWFVEARPLSAAAICTEALRRIAGV